MCKVCTKAKALPAKEGLKLIGDEMRKGKDPEHFKKALDTMLGTTEPVVDKKADAAWERSTRSSRRP